MEVKSTKWIVALDQPKVHSGQLFNSLDQASEPQELRVELRVETAGSEGPSVKRCLVNYSTILAFSQKCKEVFHPTDLAPKTHGSKLNLDNRSFVATFLNDLSISGLQLETAAGMHQMGKEVECIRKALAIQQVLCRHKALAIHQM